MVHLISLLGVLTTALVSNLPLSQGQFARGTGLSVHAGTDAIPHFYIVKFPGAPGSAEGQAGAKAFYQQMASINVPFTTMSNYTVLMNGMSIQVDDEYNDAVSMLPGVTNVWQLSATSLERASEPLGELSRQPARPMLAHNYTGVDYVHDTLDKTGREVKIGVIDAGVDYTHPAFGNCFKTPNCRIRYGYDFVGDTTDVKYPQPDNDPLEVCTQHGTHVAGIAAGNDGDFKGVAPNAILGIYRVLNCRLTTSESVVISALEKASTDGMDIVTMSFGFIGKWGESAVGDVASSLAKKGTLVVSAAGNNGNEGMLAIDGPSVSSDVLSVGSADFPFYYSQYMNVTSDEEVAIRRTMNPIHIVVPNLSKVQLVRGFAEGSTSDDTGCGPLSSYTGKVILLQNGGCGLEQKAFYAQISGAVQMIIYQSNDDALYRPDYYDPSLTFPVVSIFNSDAQYLIKKITSTAAVRISSKSDNLIFDALTPRAPSSFSAWGPGPESELKPELLGPGANIYAPFPKYAGYYGHMTGTSMSAPYIAGVAALAMENGKSNANNGTISALVNTARPQIHPTVLRPYSVAQQGAGIVHGFGATASQIIFDIRTVNGTFPDTNWRDFDVFFKYTNTGTTAFNYRLTSTGTISSSGFDSKKFLAIPPISNKKIPAIWLSTTSLKVAAGKQGEFDINLDHSAHDRQDLFLYSAYLTMYPASGVSQGFNYTIPVMGFSYMSTQVPVLPPLSSGLPCLVQSGENICLNSLRTFAPPTNYPSIAFRLQHPARRVRLMIAKSTTPTVLFASIAENQMFDYSRNFIGSGSLNYTYTWTGSIFYGTNAASKVYPDNGDYVVVLEAYTYNDALKPTTWTSIPFRWVKPSGKAK
ncbi:peptidase S8/S53 domain-containing protein [Dimargaris cristalligena]|uniref:Peptidase S8/S53 domain-containing protein n=1 Tax=Dimargaris cristalligena TaxID=215637 RepID=A0A4P9ZWH5_9FUNG|nr:peptidase S8/S53 domain-containing protein [Dimargaris cristalligena]|eukprot:RKP37994.1 peptidase S8/S53 domain-containing protein [Dimargaris cristalligena]